MLQASGGTVKGPKGQKASKRGIVNGVSPFFVQDRLMLDSDTAPGDGLKRQKGLKASKRGSENEISPLFGEETLMSDSLPDLEYRTLRRKYLLLEEENHGVQMELQEVESDVKSLEEQKLSLLDELVVLEGLIDPSELQLRGHGLP
ncbi:hypothetical protein F511_10182 [Dorcoceras hygrometricum]|uniref:Uncharacterized protein n=1 Tax=Dorcoceras hygrometricum TaxID=472368 RepID=A0A2Z7D8I4_9LAMI|nr:hypothetical protein F511_10182 [Dorcoceras hygrometricum]